MRIADILERATAAVRTTKENHVRQVKGRPGHTDIQTFIEFFRGDQMVALVTMPPDRDAMLTAALIGASGFGADSLAVSMETWGHTAKLQSPAPTNPDDIEAAAARVLHPLTGEPIKQGDLADLALNHDGIAKGWVVEGILTQVLNRAGDTATVLQPYRITGRTVEWLPRDFDTDGTAVAGRVADALAHAMRADTIEQDMARHGVTFASLGLEAERGRAHADVATVTALRERFGEHALILLAADPGTVRDQVLRERLPRSQIIRPTN